MGAHALQDEYIWLDESESDKIWHQNVDGSVEFLKLLPNKMLLRKCKYDQQTILIGKADKANTEHSAVVDQILRSMEDGLTIHQSMRLNFCEVMCIGKSNPFTKIQQKMHGVAKRYSHSLEIGDFVVMKEVSNSGRMWRGTWGKDYMVIAETHEPVAMVLKKDWAV